MTQTEEVIYGCHPDYLKKKKTDKGDEQAFYRRGNPNVS